METGGPVRRPRRRDRVMLAFAGASVLTVVDAAATYLWVRGGVAAEGNPILAALIDRLGVGVGMAGRSLWGLVLLGVLLALVPRSRMARHGLLIVTVALIMVGALHAYGLLSMTLARWDQS